MSHEMDGEARGRNVLSMRLMMAGLVVLAFVVRLTYFLYAHQVHGDAVQFAEIARALVAGDGTEIDSSWYQAFCLYQAPFQWLIADPVWAAALSSMVPGALLVWPVCAMTWRVFGRGAALLAAVLTILHPHLVNYSCNGYMESFYLFWFAVVTWMLVRLLQAPALHQVWIAGAAAGIAFATRNEFVAFFALVNVVLLATLPGFARGVLQRWSGGRAEVFLRLPARQVLVLVLCLNVAAAVTVGIYAMASQKLVGSYGLFEKTSNFGRTKDIFSQRADSALEIYGAEGQMAAPEAPPVTPLAFAKNMGARIGNNLKTGMVKAVPKLLASPVYGFAVLAGVLWLRRPRLRMDVAPVIMMLGFTPALYALIFVQPRYLQPMLPALNVLTGAGFMLTLQAVTQWKKWKPPGVPAVAAMRGALACCLVLLIATTGWRAVKARMEAEVHERVAQWVDAHVADAELLIGCGFGAISDTAFLSGNQSCPRLVTDDPEELAPYVRGKGGRWLLLFEEFIEEANPGLASALDSGVPGFTRMVEETDARGRRVQVYRLTDRSTAPAERFSSAAPAKP